MADNDILSREEMLNTMDRLLNIHPANQAAAWTQLDAHDAALRAEIQRLRDEVTREDKGVLKIVGELEAEASRLRSEIQRHTKSRDAISALFPDDLEITSAR